MHVLTHRNGFNGRRRAATLADATISYRTTVTSTTDASSYTFSSTDIGTANASRVVACIVVWEASSTQTLNSATIAGITATVTQGGSTSNAGIAIIYANVTTGTTGDIVVNFSGTVLRCSCSVWAIVPQEALTPLDSGNAVGNGGSAAVISDIEIKGGGVLIAGGVGATNAATPWTGSWNGTDTPTERVDTTIESDTAHAMYDMLCTENLTTGDFSVDGSAFGSIRGVAASWR